VSVCSSRNSTPTPSTPAPTPPGSVVDEGVFSPVTLGPGKPYTTVFRAWKNPCVK
jgi:hypothetical protein